MILNCTVNSFADNNVSVQCISTLMVNGIFP